MKKCGARKSNTRQLKGLQLGSPHVCGREKGHKGKHKCEYNSCDFYGVPLQWAQRKKP
jgi:hypothetical protein